LRKSVGCTNRAFPQKYRSFVSHGEKPPPEIGGKIRILRCFAKKSLAVGLAADAENRNEHRTDKMIFTGMIRHKRAAEYFGQRGSVQLTESGKRDVSIKDILPNSPRIGVLAIQGNYASHAQALTEAGADPVEVRKPEQLAGLDGLVLPGGESTTMLKFLEKRKFFEVLQQFCAVKPVFGTCAGAILLARKVLNPPQRSLGVLDAVVERNAYGRQIDSAIVTAETALAGGPLEMVFIRAPRISLTGPGVEVLARRDGFPVLVRQGRILAATFHPELSHDRRVHRLFVEAIVAVMKH
jgi:5'-phosphate synthase pdxT subunit